ncbi:unnamed protein product [Blepharisma stoltei]|uniref:Ribosomal protein S19 n=1 Tax=Blepharisma stoltei TaxID=1481888 RepID=A0AAU9K7Z9_9CILI|nr:unnamed protein product [Blepharisma stoltei]
MSSYDIEGTIELLRSASKSAISPMKTWSKNRLYPDHVPSIVMPQDKINFTTRARSVARLGTRQRTIISDHEKSSLSKTHRLIRNKSKEGRIDLTKVSPIKLRHVINALANKTAGIAIIKSKEKSRFLDSSKWTGGSTILSKRYSSTRLTF